MLEVLNSHGAKIDYAAAVELMDDDTREAVAADLAPCTEQEFFTAYAAAHLPLLLALFNFRALSRSDLALSRWASASWRRWRSFSQSAAFRIIAPQFK